MHHIPVPIAALAMTTARHIGILLLNAIPGIDGNPARPRATRILYAGVGWPYPRARWQRIALWGLRYGIWKSSSQGLSDGFSWALSRLIAGTHSMHPRYVLQTVRPPQSLLFQNTSRSQTHSEVCKLYEKETATDAMLTVFYLPPLG